MDRRTLLARAGAVMAVAAIAPSTFARAASWNAMPILWGDGVHDDSPGLQALIDGKPVDVRNGSARYEGSWFLAHGTYRVSAPLRFSQSSEVTITSSRFIRDPAHDGAIIEVDGGVNP